MVYLHPNLHHAIVSNPQELQPSMTDHTFHTNVEPEKKHNISNLGHVRLGSIRNKNNWNNASKHLFGSYSHSGIPGFPFRLSRNIFRNTYSYSGYPKQTRPQYAIRISIIILHALVVACCLLALGQNFSLFLFQISTKVLFTSSSLPALIKENIFFSSLASSSYNRIERCLWDDQIEYF